MTVAVTPITCLSTPSPHYTKTRRNILSKIIQGTTSTTAATILLHPSNANAASTTTLIEDRLRSTQNLTLPPPSRPSELKGIDNLYYPPWIAGIWDVTQTLTDASTPLGLKYIGGPNGSIDIATQSLNEQKKQLDIPVNFRLRYMPSKFGVAEDRLFNTRQRLDAFAGRSVVSSVEYADVGGSNRGSVLMMGGDNDTPLQTTVVRFKGPAAQKSFLIAHGQDIPASKAESKFAAYEVQRSIFALTNTNTVPPVTTDTELIWFFEKMDGDDNTVNAKLRIASYLNAQSDKLYFEARNQAVSYADYDLKFRKVI